ncbi:MAG: COX15/CtaA family protein [Candidatus Puniceispirillaceae bacterium]
MTSHNRLISYWLYMMALLVALMVVIGGITRLTGSGLSMVEWRPLIGTLPPLSQAEWMRVFTLYQASPEYQDINYGMSLAEFKLIFFWEYFHRLWGRLLGIAFALPLAYFAYRKMIPTGYKLPLFALLLLGASQGVIGWWMVKSGLVSDPTVSQYRLATHLGMALFIYGLLLWTSFNLTYGKADRPSGHLMGVVGIVAATIIAGAFVAGMDAGLLYNEYPLMGDGLLPVEYGEEGLSDPFDNPASAQFHHRWIAVLAVIGVLSLWRRANRISAIRQRGALVGIIVICQFLLGIFTLLNGVPVWLGAAHQMGAVLLLGACLWCVHGLSQKR